MTNYEKLLEEVRALGMDYRWSRMFVKKLRDDEEAFDTVDEASKKWALERGFYPGWIETYGLTEENYRKQGIAGQLLNMAVEDLRAKGISPAYLVTDHTGFYERYGWEFLCMVQGDGEPDMTRMYIHK